MTKLWQFSQRYPRPAFSEKVQRGDQGKFFKNRPKSSPRLKGLKALWRKQHHLLFSMHLKCKDCKRFWRKKLWQFSQGHPKAPFCEKVQRDDQGKFFKKSPKKWPSLQKPNSTLAQMPLSSNQNPLIIQRLKKSLAQKAAPKRPE